MIEPADLESVQIPSQLKLPFNAKMQRAILGWLLKEEKFFRLAKLQIQPEWFTEELITGRIYKIQLKLFDFFGKPPTVSEITASTDVLSEPLAEQRKIDAHITVCLQDSNEFSLEFLGRHLSDWLIAVTFAKTIKQAGTAYNQGNFDKCADIFKGIAKQASSLKFDSIPSIRMDNFQQDLQQSIIDRETALTTGLLAMDRALLDGAVHGGLIKGDMSIIMAPSNVGKTTALITIAVANILKGRRVLFMTHEGRPEDIREKFWCAMLRCSKPELLEMYKTEAGIKRFKLVIQFLKRFLTYIPYNKPGACVEDVEPIIRRAHEELAAKNNGNGYDLVISDYPAKLWTRKADKGNMPRREIDRIVYDYYVQLALEYKFHSLNAIQTNREGSKVNNGKDDRLLTKEDVSEAWGPIEIATNVICVTRSPDAKARRRMTFLIDKSRASETGVAVCCRTRFDWALTHAEDFGCLWYRGYQTLEDRIDNLLTQLSTKEKPSNVIPDQFLR